MTIPEIIVGVPLPLLGEIKEEEEQLQETTELGQPTGRAITARRVFLHTPRGRFLIRSNERDLEGRWGPDRIDCGVEETFLPVDHYKVLPVDYYNVISAGPTAQDILVGTPLRVKETYRQDWHPLFSVIDLQTVPVIMQKAAASLYDQFGYEGPVYLLVPAVYS